MRHLRSHVEGCSGVAGGAALVGDGAQHAQAVTQGIEVAHPVDVAMLEAADRGQLGGDPHRVIDRVPVHQDELVGGGGHPHESVGQDYGLRLTPGRRQVNLRRKLAGLLPELSLIPLL